MLQNVQLRIRCYLRMCRSMEPMWGWVKGPAQVPRALERFRGQTVGTMNIGPHDHLEAYRLREPAICPNCKTRYKLAVRIADPNADFSQYFGLQFPHEHPHR